MQTGNVFRIRSSSLCLLFSVWLSQFWISIVLLTHFLNIYACVCVTVLTVDLYEFMHARVYVVCNTHCVYVCVCVCEYAVGLNGILTSVCVAFVGVYEVRAVHTNLCIHSWWLDDGDIDMCIESTQRWSVF